MKKKILLSALLLVGILAVTLPLTTAPVFDAKSFKAQQIAAPAKLDMLRERLDKLGGENLSLAFVLGVKSKEALAFSSSVLAYQDYSQKRSLGILMGAAIQNASNPLAMQRVRDSEYKKLLASAPQEQYGVETTFQTLNELIKMNDEALSGVVGLAKRLNPQDRALDQTKKALKQAARTAAKQK